MQDNVSYAGFLVRFFAWLTDALVMAAPLSALYALRLFASPADAFARPVLFHYSLIDIAIYLLPVAYFTLTTLLKGATLGKALLKLKVVSADGGRLTFWQVLLRELVGRYLSTALLLIGYFLAVPDAEKRTLHDRIADTRVIYAVRPSRPAWRPPVTTPQAVTPENRTDGGSV